MVRSSNKLPSKKSLQIYESDQSSESSFGSEEKNEADDVIGNEIESESDSESSSIYYSDALDEVILAQL